MGLYDSNAHEVFFKSKVESLELALERNSWGTCIVGEIESLFSELDDCIGRVRVDATQEQNFAVRREKLLKVKEYRTVYENLQRRYTLFGSSSSGKLPARKKMGNFSRCGETDDSIISSDNRLSNLTKMASETEDIGLEALKNLNDQRERIGGIHSKVGVDLDSKMGEAEGVLTRLQSWFPSWWT